MDGFVDLEDAIKAEMDLREKRLEKLSGFSAILMLAVSIWLAWPSINSTINGGSLNSDLRYAMVIIAWAVFVQDLGSMEKQARSRIGTVCTIFWLPITIVALNYIEGNTSEILGMSILISVSGALFITSRNILRGDISVLKYRAIMGFLGLILSVSLLTTADFDNLASYLQLFVCLMALALVLYDWYGNDDMRQSRKEFDVRLNNLESVILNLRSEGVAIDQAASLVMTGREEGHRDPEWGMRLLDEAEEDIERTLSLAGDIDEIKEDSLKAISEAEKIAPVVKRPRKAWDMGQRELELGSLREGEALFRQAKKNALEIIKWWAKAENAIAEASNVLSKSEHKQQNLEDLLMEAKKKLASEKPKQAFEFAMVIPEQILAGEKALIIAEKSVKDAAKLLKSADGLDKTQLEQRLDDADDAILQGNSAHAKGLADGIIREINSEREAMDDVRRALRQKKHLVSRWAQRDDIAEWDSRLTAIEEEAENLRWTSAASLLDKLTTDLDSVSKESEEASELIEYLTQQWAILRNQCDASNISVGDDDRKEVEKAIAIAKDSLKVGNTEVCLESLGLADKFMERLQRRV